MDEDQETLLTRRRLLATGAIAAASVTLPVAGASAKTYTANTKKLKPLPRYVKAGWRRARFEPHAGTGVKLRPPGGAALRGQLVGVEDVPYIKSLAGDQDVFTLRFRGPALPVLPEGIVGVRHKHFGTIHLYVTPAAAGGASQDYLAAINRHIPRRARRRMQRR